MNSNDVEGLSPEENAEFTKMMRQIDQHSAINHLKMNYYQGEHAPIHLGVSIPKALARKLGKRLGWGGTAVDVVNSRVKFQGWFQAGTADYGLTAVYNRNHLKTEAKLAHLTALIFGQAYICVGTGDPAKGEPDPLVTVESPMNMTGVMDGRQRRLVAAASRWGWDAEKRKHMYATLYLPNVTVSMVRGDGNQWVVSNRDEHMLGRVPVTRVVHRPNAKQPGGRSVITHALRGHIDNGIRCLTDAEYARAYYAVPRAAVVHGADTQLEIDEDGVSRTGASGMGKMAAFPYDENHPEAKPEFIQFPANSTEPFFKELAGLTELVAGEIGVPQAYLGAANDQAMSSDAIKALETRLIDTAVDCQDEFSLSWMEVAELCLLVRDRSVPEAFYDEVGVSWNDPKAITLGAAADAIQKLTSCGAITADSEIIGDLLGLKDKQRLVLAEEKRKARATSLLAGLPEAAKQAEESSPAVKELASKNSPAEEAE